MSIVDQIRAAGVTVSLDGDSILLTGADEARARVKSLAIEHKSEIIAELRRRAAWDWLGPAPDAALDWAAYEQWDFVTGLREYLTQERFELVRAGKTFIVLAEAPYDPHRLKWMDICIDGAGLCRATLTENAASFPELTPDRAWAILQQLQQHHDQEGFRIRPNCGGLDFPDWPLSVCENLQTIYAAALQEDS